ncbi:NUDIX domain-containing protein [Desulfuromonas carbonis]|uniref:NUDIX hydrolase n=1 Tax=Desulfuromonas sp. DDH964 TaxID=1823759 RepID=UPI00078E6E89|nr:NUDIX domain-containing protein [Desulfuromonas sp. DDH964]AMV72034.1 Isopentenyl-diphosphate Delta-isomerase [Desulfuromonas sp. DDH964]
MSHPKTEMFEIVDEQDRVIGIAPRSACHGNPALVHRVAHVLVFRPGGELLLQKRSRHKDIQPGKWDTSVGGHLDPGEDYLAAAVREMREELGLRDLPLTFLYRSRIRNEIESENVATYLALHAGAIRFAAEEIEEVRFWRGAEIDAALGSGLFTPNFEMEWRLFLDWYRRRLGRTPTGITGGADFAELLREVIESEGER